MREGKTNTRKLALSAILCAFSVLLIFLGSVIDVMDLTAAMLASILIAVVLIEAGGNWPWLTYAAVSVLSFLLIPNKLPAVIFILTGYYPIIKQRLERLNPFVSYLLKLLVFNVLMTVFLFICSSFFPGVDLLLIPSLSRGANIAIAYALGNAVFVLYDFALSKLITYYIFVLRDRLRIERK
ncbi:MAG: hypothetical protein E7640_03355 [Ruminococcaceae bacterium]|nr:hypothetical protein [Oscillospiraceae bacterium]